MNLQKSSRRTDADAAVKMEKCCQLRQLAVPCRTDVPIQLFFYSPMKMTYEISLNIPVAQRYSILGFPVAKLSIKLIGQRYAPMFAAGAADRHHQLVFAFFNIIWNQKSQQICQLVQKNPASGKLMT